MSVWPALASRRGLRNLAATAAATTTSAAIGALATTPESEWYLALDTPAWQPPPLAFPLVWTPLYADIAAVTATALTVLEQEGRVEEANALRRTLAANLVLNTGWSVLFWRSRQPWLSAIWCALLTAQSAHLARTVGEVDPWLRRALTAYPAWCGFATALNVSIALRNS